MGMIKRLRCLINGHYMPGSTSVNKDGYFTVTCVKCGKCVSIKPLIIDKDINHGRHTNKSRI